MTSLLHDKNKEPEDAPSKDIEEVNLRKRDL